MSSRVFQPARLRLARKLRGLRQNEVASELRISPAAVSQYESGTLNPSAETIGQLAFVLKCRPMFFFRELRNPPPSGAFFRSLRRTPQSERDRAESYALVLAELGALLDEEVELPAPAIPAIDLPQARGSEAIEAAALRLRAVWAVPPGPVANVVRLLELHGAIVAAVGDFDERLDAFSLWAGDRPVVVLCSAKGVARRRRFDAAHELGHLTLHEHPEAANAGQERDAHRFASAFLMPAEEIDPWLPRRSNQFELLREASDTWGVSMQAVLYRAKTLGVLSESSFTRAMRRMTVMGWRTNEPVENSPAEERPAVLGAALEALRAGGGSLEQLADRVGLPVGRVERMLAVPEEGEPDGRLISIRRHRIDLAAG